MLFPGRDPGQVRKEAAQQGVFVDPHYGCNGAISSTMPPLPLQAGVYSRAVRKLKSALSILNCCCQVFYHNKGKASQDTSDLLKLQHDAASYKVHTLENFTIKLQKKKNLNVLKVYDFGLGHIYNCL